MDTSTNEDNDSIRKVGGAFADGLTLIRALLTPVVMYVIVTGWPDNLHFAIFASLRFAIAALTDIFDDMTGGAENSRYRKFGWFDDIADTVLILGTLLAMVWVIWKHGLMSWAFMIPAIIIIAREIIVGLAKGSSFRDTGWPETSLGTAKTAITMLAVCLLLASPWLTTWMDSFLSTSDNVMIIYDTPSPYLWWIGQGLLWLAAIISIITGYKLLKSPADMSHDG